MIKNNDVFSYDELNDIIDRIIKQIEKVNSSLTVLENNARSMYEFYTYPKNDSDKKKKDAFHKIVNRLMTILGKIKDKKDSVIDVNKQFEMSNFLAKCHDYIDFVEDLTNQIELEFDTVKLITPSERFERPLNKTQDQIIEFNKLVNLLIQKYDDLKSKYRSMV